MLAEIALQLEFIRLAQLTGEERWTSLAHRGLDYLFKDKPGPQWLDDGFPPVTDHEAMYTMAARADRSVSSSEVCSKLILPIATSNTWLEALDCHLHRLTKLYQLKTHLLTAGTIPVYGEQYLKSIKVMMNRRMFDFFCYL